MNKLHTFLRILYRSAIDSSYYRDVVASKISFSLKYFFALHILIVFISSSAFAFTLGRFDVSQVSTFFQSVYPRDLSIRLHNGEIEINRDLPFVINMPQELREDKDTNTATIAAALVVFDSNEHMSTISSFWSYNALAVVTKNAVYYRKDADSREIRVTEIPRDISFDFSSALFDEKISSIVHHPFFSNKWHVPVFSFFYFLISFPFVFAWSLAVSLVYAFFSYVVVRAMFSSQFSYSTLWQMTLHALTGGIILGSITDAFGFYLIHGVAFLLCYALWMYVVVKNLQSHSVKRISRKSLQKKHST